MAQEKNENDQSGNNGENETFPIEAEVGLRYKMFAEPLPAGKEWPVTRRSRAVLCLQTWKRIGAEKDIRFDPGDMPEVNVAPPIETGLPPGVSPSEIKDKELRKEYEQAVEKNKLKIEYHDRQYRLRKMENEYKRIATSYLTSMYAKPPKDLEGIAGLLEKYVADTTEAENLMGKIRAYW